MIRKAYLVAVLIVLSAIVTIVVLGASGVEANGTNIPETTAVATTKDTNEKPLELKETTEPEPETSTTEAPTETTDVADESTEKTTEPVVSTEPEKTYTDDDLFYLAAAVCREAGGESEEIQLLVANVVINRVNSSIYPDTIYGVLTDYRQYGMMWKYGVSFPKWADQKTIDHCYDVARRILDGERVCPDNVLFQAEFVQGSGIYKEFDGFYFCYYE